MPRSVHSRYLHENEYSVKDVSPILRKRSRMFGQTDSGQLKGSESGRGARFKALDAMIMRRKALRGEAASERKAKPAKVESLRSQAERSDTAGVKKGLFVRGGTGVSQDEMEDMISGKKRRY